MNMKNKHKKAGVKLISLAVALFMVVGLVAAQLPSILPISPVTVSVIFQQWLATYVEARFYDGDNSHYVAIASPTTVAANITFTLPSADGTANQVLKTDGALALGWTSVLLSGTYDADTNSKVDLGAGGTNISSAGVTNGQLLIGNTTGNVFALASLTGTANQVTVTNGASAITLSLPQSIAAASSPAFTGLTLSGLNTANGIVRTDGSGVLSTSVDLPTATTIGTAYVYRADGTDVAVADGGTNIGVYAVGDLLYASTTGVLSKLAGVAAGSVLVSGGVNTAPAYASFVGLGLANVAGTRLTLPLENDPVTPTLAFGDGDSGFYESGDDTLAIATGGAARLYINADGISCANATGPFLLNEAVTSTNPTLLPHKTDYDTGLGWAAADQLSLIAGGVEGIRISEATTIDVGVFGNLTRKFTVTTNDADSAQTYTAAQMLGGLIRRGTANQITANRIDVTDTAAAIVAAIPGCIVGSGFEFSISNEDSTHTIQLDGGVGVTIAPTDPSTAIPVNSTGRFLVVVTNATAASEAVTIHCLGIVGH